ncbi:hypothetical protein O181_035758 [Austropuccinia psidii MF-1]|uniref:Folic acid synthesis protein FOL1 n=1 Tax=Austropuccinia psidii MF-1 TaxID=1389203 RepID=A0A9Q3H8J3_9BASI|nr:hypothetical protein [Austropuccinia psidii MF-1]
MIKFLINSKFKIFKSKNFSCKLRKTSDLQHHLNHYFSTSSIFKFKNQSSASNNIVYLSLGSNLGHRVKNINQAINSLCSPIQNNGAGALLLNSSFIYQSIPMYLKNQPLFLNTTCKISTPLSPWELLNTIKKIERDQGRKLENSIRNGPRPIDIDILFFNSQIISHDNLSIPHLSISEREFVLRPLNDIAPNLIHPKLQLSISSILKKFQTSNPSTLQKIHPIYAPDRPTLDISQKTHLMSIVNCTPDSFSDPGLSFDLSNAIKNSLNHLHQGADILDIGGMSTRPQANDVSLQEEINRTIPLIKALRQSHHIQSHISIDTFRATTAQAAIEAGATIINDVSGGQADSNMYKIVAKLDVPFVMMHMRGNPRSMNKLTNYPNSDIINGVRNELSIRLNQAIEAGIKRWNIILDPGIGFAKDLIGNCQLINSLDQLTNSDPIAENPIQGFPLLIGVSRKSFIGQLLSQDPLNIPPPHQRIFGTAAACALSIMRGARIIRVHDTSEMLDLIKVLDGIKSHTQSSP